MMALGVASVVVGTLIGRYTEGPTGSATHLYVVILAPTGYGKDHPLQCGVKLMNALDAGDLIGPGTWVSGPGFVNRLKRNPLMVCFMDELGDTLNLAQDENVWVHAILAELKKCYNAFSEEMTGESKKEASEKITFPCPSIVLQHLKASSALYALVTLKTVSLIAFWFSHSKAPADRQSVSLLRGPVNHQRH
jgi:hypothetical protein